MDNKWLYIFSVNKETEVEETTEQEVNGEKVKITKKVKKQLPINFALKRPNRSLMEQADMFYGVKLSEGIRAGLLTRALLLKRYRNDGGALSDADSQYFYELTSRLSSLEEDHQRIMINMDKLPEGEKDKKLSDVVKQKMEVLQSLQSLESLNQALFAHTAEAKAQVQLNNWWIVNLAYWDKEGKGEFIEFFQGNSFDKKMNQWDSFEENPESYIVEALTKFALLIGLWNAGAKSKEEFQQGEKDYGTLADETTEIKNEETSPSIGNLGSSEITANA